MELSIQPKLLRFQNTGKFLFPFAGHPCLDRFQYAVDAPYGASDSDQYFCETVHLIISVTVNDVLFSEH